MGTLSSELRPFAPAAPRVYVDANMPAGVVAAMRRDLGWDVLFVLEHASLRRASDRDHFVHALELGRTLITLDRDFADATRFPPALGPGIVVCSAPDEPALVRLLREMDRDVLRGADLPLRGRTIELAPGTSLSLPHPQV